MTKQKNKILFNVDESIGKLAPHMFGANLEHIGEAIYKNGVWAEVIENRKFCGPDKLIWENGLNDDHLDFGIIKPWKGCNPSAQHVMYAHSNSEYIVKGEEQINRFGSGKQSQQITIRKKSEKNRGIKQSINVNFINEEHQFSIMLKGTGQKVYIQIGELNFVIKSRKKWFEFKKNIKFNDLKTKKTLSITINSDEIFIANCSLMPKNTIFGFRKDVTKLIQQWLPSYIRWPGGNYLSGYNWINGIGDKNYRLPFYDFAWYAWENNDVGTDEFMQWCEYIGSEPMITVNTGNGTPEEAASWIQYLTGTTKTKYGKLRSTNGRDKPYNLKTIFIGNEMFGGWQIGHTDAKTYAFKYDKFVKAIKKVNKNLRFIAVGACSDHFGHWNEIVLKHIKERIDELSIHYYSIRTEKDKIHPHYTSRYIPTVAASTEVEIMLDRTIKEIKKNTKKNITIAFDEWNTYVEAEHPNYIENYNIADALYAASLLSLGKFVRDQTRTLSIAVASGVSPISGEKIFHLDDDEVFIGMGVHGESGYGRQKISSSKKIIKLMMDKIFDDYKYKEGDIVVPFINGSGATTLMELLIIYNDVEEYLAQYKIKIYKPLINEYITTQESAGFSISLLNSNEQMRDLWISPSSAPYFHL